MLMNIVLIADLSLHHMILVGYIGNKTSFIIIFIICMPTLPPFRSKERRRLRSGQGRFGRRFVRPARNRPKKNAGQQHTVKYVTKEFYFQHIINSGWNINHEYGCFYNARPFLLLHPETSFQPFRSAQYKSAFRAITFPPSTLVVWGNLFTFAIHYK